MSVDLGDDATYFVRGVGSIFFQMPSDDVLQLSDVIFVLGLKNNIIFIFMYDRSLLYR
jgi:hypothetical protein